MTLAGTTFVRNGETYDYCYLETIKSLLDFCDHVFVVDAGSDDGTYEKIKKLTSRWITVISRPAEEWHAQQGTGKSKLCYFTDIALQAAEDAGYDYQFYLQCDEIVHEKSYHTIRRAIETREEAYFSTRINLWESPYLMLQVPQNRKPCSTEIVRLTKTKYRSYGDAESIASPSPNVSYINDIRIYHMGFVRKREVMKDKIINMQEGVFELGHHDPKLDGHDIFQPRLWFGENDLVPISEELPSNIQKWAKERVYL